MSNIIQEYYGDFNSVPMSVVGPEENGTTASRAYAVGEHFVKDGHFCTAITTIAQGAPFTLNTNYIRGSIADALSDTLIINSTNLNGLASDDYFYFYDTSAEKNKRTSWSNIKAKITTKTSKSGKTGTTPDNGYYYVDVSLSDITQSKIISLLLTGVSQGVAFLGAPYTSGGVLKVRVYTNLASTTVIFDVVTVE